MLSINEYELENYRSVPVFNTCPNCQKENTYQRYISTETGISVANDVGKCVPQNGCGYNYRPFDYSIENRGIPLPIKKGMPSNIPK